MKHHFNKNNFDPVVTLSPDLLVGRGSERACYRHPNDADLCIKVAHKQQKHHRSQNVKDFSYYQKLERKAISWEHIPRCHGWIETNLGWGLIFDFLKDEQGQPLPMLDKLLREGLVTLNQIQSDLDELRHYLLENGIFADDLRDSNIACRPKSDGHYHLYLLDGLGYSQVFKIATLSTHLGRKNIEKNWNYFYDHRMQKWQTPESARVH